MSRQRIRASVLESSTEPCPQCGGTGHVRSVSSVALQLLRGIEEVLMKGATHNLVVRTRTDVALYVLNHKRGHLRDLENAFKVSLSIVSDPNVSGLQSYIIDRGEQVHTLEAAKALLAAQAAAAAAAPAPEEAYGDEEAFDGEFEVETEETEGLTDETAAGEQEGSRRRRRRRRRSRGGEARESGAPREDNAVAQVEAEAQPAAQAEDGEADDDETEEQPGLAQADQAGGERRPRRRGRRGGRRRRGGGMDDDGLAGSIADELAPPASPEAVNAAADFDDASATPTLPEVQPEPIAPAAEPHGVDDQPAQAATSAPLTETASAAEPELAEPEHSEKAGPRRSTVREKVTFLSDTQPVVAPESAQPAASEPASPATGAEPAGETSAPRRAGWWSRRFGGE
jgi:ribonuclease E